jgi:hypothetical protein
MLIAFLIICFTFVETHAGQSAGKNQFASCVPGEPCTIKGKLNLQPGQPPAWAALAKIKGECAKLALPDEFYRDAKLWNGQIVEVTGRAFQQPSFEDKDGTATLWYTEGDRKLATWACDGSIGIYVDTMRSRSGRTWPPQPK